MIDIQVNQYQTPLTQEFLSQFPDEVLEQFYDIVNNVEFVKWLISPNRPYAKDCPHDEQGRVIVDIAHPHIIENADYFRQPAIHFMKHGCYTFLKPNSNPHSEYRKFWAEEIRRIREGYVRESDGEWVTGFCYWFLNYNPMMVNMITEGKKKADRVESFPFFFEGIYWRFHYLYQAREAGKHAIELAKRGAHPYTEKVFTPDGWKLWQDIKVGDKLFGSNGNIVTVIGKPADDLMPYYNITLRDGRVISASDDHLWQVEVHGKKGIQTLTTLQLLEIYKKKRKPSNRVPSGIEYTTKILTNKGVELPVKDTLVDPYTFGLLLGDGCFRHLSCYFTQEDKDLEEERPYIPYNIVKWNSKYSYRIDIPNWRNILKKYGLEDKKSEDKFIPDEYKYNSKEVRLNILKGLFDSDGTVHGGVPVINTTSKQLKEDITEISRSLGYEVYTLNRKGSYKVNGIRKDCLNYFSISVYAEAEIFNLPRKKAKVHYTSPNSLSRKRGSIITDISFAGYSMCKCLTVDAEDECYLIGDFVTTHNCAKSYSLASIMTHNLELGESETSKKRVTTVLTAYQKEYLKDDKDGTLSKFRPALSFIQTNTPFPRLMLKSSPNEMSWQMGYKDEFNRDQGSFNMVLGVSAKDDADKLRGKRGWILFEEMGTFAGLLALYDTTRKSVEDGDYTFATMYLVGCVCAGTKVWTSSGENKCIESLLIKDGILGFTDTLSISKEEGVEITLNRGLVQNPITSNIITGIKPCYKITLTNGNTLECSEDHPILIQKNRQNHDGSIHYYQEVFKQAKDLKVGDRVLECRTINIFGNDSLPDSRFIGMMIGDGSYGKGSIRYCSEDQELLDYVKSRYQFKVDKTHITAKGLKYEEGRINGIRPMLKKIGISGQVKQYKRLPSNYQTLCEKDVKLLLSGLYDTDGTFILGKEGSIEITQSNREILEQIQLLWRKFGVIGSINITQPTIKENRKDKNPWYNLVISGRYNILNAHKVLTLLIKRKQDKLDELKQWYLDHPSKKEQKYPKDVIMHRVKSIEYIGEQQVYNLTAGISHTYLANNIITHNTANEAESDFSSAKKLLQAPDGYNILSVPNVYDRKGQGSPRFGFFYPAYINRLGCCNHDGVSDVIKALFQVLMARYKAKYNSADPKSVLRVIAEDPITPAEAIVKVKAAYFPVQALNERLNEIDSHPNFYDRSLIGTMIFKGGKAEFRPTGDIPIREYGVPNDTQGALEIFEMPEKDENGDIFKNRYIIGHDPVDNDDAESKSLSSTFVFDLLTDNIVAEFTGRKPYADDNFEIVRCLCLFYNAKCLYESNKKGIYAYFKKMNSTHLLADTPEYLRDKEMVKYSAFGSGAKGVNASAAINNYANDLLRNWLLTPKMTLITDDDGTQSEQSVPTLYSIRSRGLLEELIAFNPEINVDRIRAMGMVMLYRQEKVIAYQGDMTRVVNDYEDKDYAGNDDFFTQNFDEKFNIKDMTLPDKWQ